jgi:hypothetical protein
MEMGITMGIAKVEVDVAEKHTKEKMLKNLRQENINLIL